MLCVEFQFCSGIQQQCEETLTKCSNDMARMPDSSPKAVDQFSRSLLSTMKPIVAGLTEEQLHTFTTHALLSSTAIKFHLYIAISLCDSECLLVHTAHTHILSHSFLQM